MEKFVSINPIGLVAKFHETFGHPIVENPAIPAPERSNLRVELLQEELNELKQAIADNNIVEVADALCDLQYVLSGAVLEFGLGEKFPALFEEVQRSNMSKACKDKQEALDTQSKYLHEDIATIAEEKGDYWIVTRAGDNKILKNINYSKANLKPILDDE